MVITNIDEHNYRHAGQDVVNHLDLVKYVLPTEWKNILNGVFNMLTEKIATKQLFKGDIDNAILNLITICCAVEQRKPNSVKVNLPQHVFNIACRLAIERNQKYGNSIDVMMETSILDLVRMKLYRTKKLPTDDPKYSDELYDSINYLIYLEIRWEQIIHNEQANLIKIKGVT